MDKYERMEALKASFVDELRFVDRVTLDEWQGEIDDLAALARGDGYRSCADALKFIGDLIAKARGADDALREFERLCSEPDEFGITGDEYLSTSDPVD